MRQQIEAKAKAENERCQHSAVGRTSDACAGARAREIIEEFPPTAGLGGRGRLAMSTADIGPVVAGIETTIVRGNGRGTHYLFRR